uniref:Uncharacterized protein n=1 Tax=Globodera rostochiensis TaxID=31243 RepID=A0A914HSQ5_GLORO
MCQGGILIGTMLIARGVDMNPADDYPHLYSLKPTPLSYNYKSKCWAGDPTLAHITAFPPRNNRVEEQVAGRVARKGQPGSGCLIIRKSDIKRLISDGGGCQNEEWSDRDWENWRDKREALVADQLTSFLQNRIPILSFRDELYKRMCDKMGVGRSICEEEEDYCQYAAVQIQELWSFWINRFDHEIAALIEEGKKAGKTVTDVLDKPTKDGFFRQFDEFIASKIGQLNDFVANPSKSELLENPAYLIKTAHLMLNSEHPEIAKEMIKKVDPNDHEFGPITLYYEAKAHNVGVAKIKDCIEIDEAALKYKKDKEEAKKAEEQQKKQAQEKQQKSAPTEPPRTANPSGPDDPPPDEPAAEDGNGDDDVPIPTDALETMKDAGLSHFYNLDIAMPVPSMWTIGLLFIVGLAQIAFGSVLAFGTGGAAAKWGWSLISGGWDDVKTSFAMVIDPKGKMAQAFSWVKWLAQKVVHYGKVVLGMLAKTLASKFPAVKKFFEFCGHSVDDAPALTKSQAQKQLFRTTVIKDLPQTAQKGLVMLDKNNKFCKFLDENPNFAQNIQMGASLVTDIIVDHKEYSKISKNIAYSKEFKQSEQLKLKRSCGRKLLKQSSAFGCQMGQNVVANKFRESCSKKRAKKDDNDGNFWSHLLEETVSAVITSDLIPNATVNLADKACTHMGEKLDEWWSKRRKEKGKRKEKEDKARMQKRAREMEKGAKGQRNGAKEEEEEAKKVGKESKAKRAEEAQQACNELIHPTASDHNELGKALKKLEDEIAEEI